jgi:transcriptional regulator with XRE-family HTH domain
MKIEPEIGTNIRRRRLELGLSQEAFARDVGIATRHLGRIEHGSISATIGLLARIAATLDCDVGDLLKKEDVPMPPNLPRGRGGAPREEAGAGRRIASWFDLPCRKKLEAGNFDKSDLDTLQKILFLQKPGSLADAAEQMVADLIARVGGERNLTTSQRRNIALARAWAAARDSGEIDSGKS